jgi:hypothetical protein
MRTPLSTTIIVACFVSFSAQAMQFPKPVKPGEEPWRKPFKAALEKKVTGELKKPLEEVVEWFREQAGVTFVVDPVVQKDAPTLTVAAKDVPLSQALQTALAAAKLDYEVRDMAIFIFNPAKLNKDMLLPEELPVSRLLDNREEVLNFEPKDMAAGDAIKQLTEQPGIALKVADDAVGKAPITLKLKDIGLGYAIRWVVRFAGGKIAVDRDGMKVVKR